jgi:serine protease Do
MRKRRIIWAMAGVALLALALTGAVAGRALAQSDARPWLGVTTQEITSELREGLDYRGSGVIVNSVIPDSPAERAGMRKGDVIVSVDSRMIDSPSELVEVVRSARVGKTVAVTVVRDGSRRTLTPRLSEWPAEIDEEMDAPAPAPTPRAPKPPSAPREQRFEWNGEEFDLPDGAGLSLLRSMGRGRLGIQVQDLNADLGEALGAPGAKGVLVIEVFEDRPAARAGIKAGDVITRVGDTAVDDIEALHRTLRDRDGRVTVTVMRRGVRRTVTVELEAEKQAERRVIRVRGGGSPTELHIPDVRTRELRDLDDEHRADLEAQLRELRQELRELRRKLEAMDKN